MSGRERMKGIDALWLQRDTPSALMNAVAVLELGGEVEHERLLAALAERLVDRHPRLRQRVMRGALGLGGPRWEADPDFSLARQIARQPLPDGGLDALLASLMSRPLPQTRPQWRVVVTEGERGPALVFCFHQSAFDAQGLGRLLLSLLDGAPPPAETGLAKAVPLTGLPGVLSAFSVSPAPDSALRGRPGPNRRVARGVPAPLGALEALGRAAGATTEEVVLAALAGALRAHMREKGALLEAPEVLVSSDLRGPASATAGSHHCLFRVPLPAGRDTPRERITTLCRSMDDLGGRPGAMAGGLQLSHGAAPAFLVRPALSRLAATAVGVVSDVRGPREPAQLCGAPVQGLLTWAPRLGRMSFSLTWTRCGGQYTLGLALDPEILDADPAALLAAMGEELGRLRGSYGLGDAPAAAPAEAPAAPTPAEPPAEEPATAEVPAGEAAPEPAPTGEPAPEAAPTEAPAEDSQPEAPASSEPPAGEPDRCAATTKSGRRCKNRPLPDSTFCRIHQPPG
jgi:diacylglycerol O-acyltransferase